MRHALLGTLPGRAIVVGALVKLLVGVIGVAAGSMPALLRVIDTVATLAIAGGAGYFGFRLFVLAKRRLLWRVRRKLILSYIFIGFVPAILLIAFFVLGGLVLFFNFSSYLIQSEVTSLQDRARFIAASTAIDVQLGGGRNVADVLERRRTSVNSEFSDVSLAAIPTMRTCPATDSSTSAMASGVTGASGPWQHAEPPGAVPDWIDCAGFAGLLTIPGRAANENRSVLVVRALAFPDVTSPRFAIVVDVPIDDAIKQRWRRNTGVQVGAFDASAFTQPVGGGNVRGAPTNWVMLLSDRDWATGRTGTLFVSTQLSIPEVYDRITAAQGLIGNRSFAQVLLLVLLFVVGGLFLVIDVVALLMGLALAKSITGSVHELFAGTERVRQGDFAHKIAVKAADQLGDLAQSFNSMTASIDGLMKDAAEKKRLEEELRIAHEIQMSLLPQGALVMPGLSVNALCVPAREVGGDYYDFFQLDEARLGVLIADVSGKGTSAALYMAELKGLMLSLSRIHSSPRDVLIAANRIISEHLDARSFITVTYAVLDLRRRTMTYARAGHTPLMYIPGPGADTQSARVLAPDGMVLGLKVDNGELFERLLEEDTVALHAGDLYVLFTDGVTEAMNAADDCFGEGRLGQVLERDRHLGSEALRERVLSEVEAFVNGAPQHDDMTMILLKIEDDGESLAAVGRAAAHQLV
jgi:sigma-B regulation protein RsbU (phosphoserine phosphatase)